MNTVTFEEILARDGKLIYKTKGHSMRPMLHQNRDLVIIEPKTERLKRFDVALYKHGGKYILHRVIKVNAEDYTFRGDHNYFKEPGIKDHEIIGILTAFVRKGKQHSTDEKGYRFLVRLWAFLYPFRALAVKIKHLIKKIVKRQN